MNRIKQNKNKSQRDKMKILNRWLMATLVFCGIYFLIGVNDLSIRSYMLQQQTKQFKNIKNDNNELELKVMSLSSYNNLSQKIADLKMVKVDKVDYINTAAAVALKK